MASEKKEEIEELKKIPPKERLKKIKELREKRKKEEEEAKKLLDESIEEIEFNDAEEERKAIESEETNIDAFLNLQREQTELEKQIKSSEEIEIESVTGADYGQIMQHAEEAQRQVNRVSAYMDGGDEGVAKRIWGDAYDQMNQDLQKLNAAGQESSTAYSNLSVAKEHLRRMGYTHKWVDRRGGER